MTDTQLSITSRLYPARPALMSRLNPPPFSRRQPSAQHLKTDRTRDCNSSDGRSAIVLTSTFAPTMPDRSHDNCCKAWQWPVFSSNQMQLAMASSAESIRMVIVESSRASGSKMSIRFQGARQMLLPWCSLLANMLIDQSLSNSLILFIYAARKLINNSIAEKMLVYRHGS